MVHRLLSDAGYRCDVIATSLIPKKAGDRVKTDRRDAQMLARLHRAGELTNVWVPGPEQEAMRNLSRLREDMKEQEECHMKQRLSAFLLRRGLARPEKIKAWSPRLTHGHPPVFGGRHESNRFWRIRVQREGNDGGLRNKQ